MKYSLAKLVLTVLKMSFSKNKLKEISYRDYNIFHDELQHAFSNLTVDACYKFDKVFLEILNKDAPLKRKLLSANHVSYVSKAMRKAIMKRSSLEKSI